LPPFIRDKVNFERPYFHTGIDYTGHMFVKYGDTVTKMYMLVFTCLCIRSIHIELLPSMSCKDFLLAFTRFTNIYSVPSSIYSDNASTFLQGMGILSKSHIDSDFQSFLLKNSIKHYRIPLYAAWAGSAWERLIRTIKSCLYKVLGRKRVEYFTLLTILSDIENAVNSRPLTYNDNLSSILCPNSFLKCESGRSIIYGSVAGEEIPKPTRKDLMASLGQREDMLASFKDLWYEDYLLSLRENSRDVFQKDWENKVKINEVVLISSTTKSRAWWQLGLITELNVGRDGLVRSAKVKRADRTEALYPISMLHPLEISSESGSSL